MKYLNTCLNITCDVCAGSPFSMDMEGMVGRVRSLGNGTLCVPISRPAVIQIENSRPVAYEGGKDVKPVVDVTGM